MRHLHLIVPELLAAPPERKRTPALAALLARGRAGGPGQAGPSAALGALFGLPAGCPLAPIGLAMDGADPGVAWWLRADPVHLRLNIDKLVLHEARLLGLAQDEADTLVASLNAHFRQDGLEFLAPHPERWYLRLPGSVGLATTPVDTAAGRAIDALLPSGPDAGTWRARLTEAQMLLHAHPVNAAREARGEAPVNSLWLWGAGAAPQPARPAFEAVFALDANARALAQATAIPSLAPPEDYAGIAQDIEHALVVLDALDLPSRHNDPSGRQAALAAYETGWFAPVLSALQWGRLKRLTLEGTGDSPVKLEVDSTDAWRLWRRA